MAIRGPHTSARNTRKPSWSFMCVLRNASMRPVAATFADVMLLSNGAEMYAVSSAAQLISNSLKMSTREMYPSKAGVDRIGSWHTCVTVDTGQKKISVDFL
eukprot:6199482-Pleurochrysis_carterae.AAC.1